MLSLTGKISDPAFLGGMVLFFLSLMVLLVFLWRNRDLLSILLLSYFLICSGFILVADYYNFVWHNDSYRYYIPVALQTAHTWRQGLVEAIVGLDLWQHLSHGIPGYITPLALSFFVFHDSMIAGRLLSTIFGALTIYQLYQLTKTLYDYKTANITAFLVVFSPYYCWMSISILRESISLFFIVWIFRLWQLYEIQPAFKLRVLFLFALFYLGLLRPEIMLFIIMVMVITKTIFNPNWRVNFIIKGISLATCVLIMLFISAKILQSEELTQLKATKGIQMAQLDYLAKRIQGSSEAGSSYGAGIQYTSYWGALKYMPLLIVYFMASPFPWQVTKASHALGLLDSMVLWMLYFLFLLEFKSFIQRNKKWAGIIFTYILLGASCASVIQGNMGAALRHRMLFTILIIPFAAHQILIKLEGKREAPLGPQTKRQIPGGVYGGPKVTTSHRQVMASVSLPPRAFLPQKGSNGKKDG